MATEPCQIAKRSNTQKLKAINMHGYSIIYKLKSHTTRTLLKFVQRSSCARSLVFVGLVAYQKCTTGSLARTHGINMVRFVEKPPGNPNSMIVLIC